MAEHVTLHGYRFSVYNRIARMVVHEKGVSYDTVEADPFADPDPAHLELHPFGRVPALSHGPFTVYETTAIARYIDCAFPGPSLQPDAVQAAARLNQVIAITDNYGYRPMVRQVFSHRVFRPKMGEPYDENEITAGLRSSHTVLAALNDISGEGHVLNGRHITLADCHLAPMVDYFTRAAEGREALTQFPALQRWWEWVSGRSMMTSTDPGPFDPQR